MLAAGAAVSEREGPVDALAALAGALSDGNAAAFLARVDERTPGYPELARNVRALTARGPVSSSIDPAESKGDDNFRSMRLNWILDIQGSRRRESVRCDLERRGDTWYVIRLEPASFFAGRQ